MFRKYEHTPRILVPDFPNVVGKRYWSPGEVNALLSGKVHISEKMDGANTGIIRTRDGIRMQKRGSLVDVSEHEQFNRFKKWTWEHYESLLKLPFGTILYGELMFCVHSIYYDKLPDWFLAFRAWDKKTNSVLPPDELNDLCKLVGVKRTPELYYGYADRNFLVRSFWPKITPSNYGSELGEGIVVWNPKKNIHGKVVRPEFMKRMQENDHWIHQEIRFNKVVL